MKANINTSQYVFAYGKQPRGTGNWWFKVNNVDVTVFGTYSEACKRVRKYAKEIDATEIKLLS